MEAEVVLEYDDDRTAEAVAKAVSPDNFRKPAGLSIQTTRHGSKVITAVRHAGGFSTFIATIDDLLFCISTAEKALRTASNLEGDARTK